MKRTGKRIWLAVLMVFGAGLFHGFKTAVKRMRTVDTMSFVCAAASKTLATNTWPGWDAVSETIKRFPNIPTRSHQLLDEWGNPIAVSVVRSNGGFSVELTSGGGGLFFDHTGRVKYGIFLSDEGPRIGADGAPVH